MKYAAAIQTLCRHHSLGARKWALTALLLYLATFCMSRRFWWPSTDTRTLAFGLLKMLLCFNPSHWKSCWYRRNASWYSMIVMGTRVEVPWFHDSTVHREICRCSRQKQKVCVKKGHFPSAQKPLFTTVLLIRYILIHAVTSLSQKNASLSPPIYTSAWNFGKMHR